MIFLLGNKLANISARPEIRHVIEQNFSPLAGLKFTMLSGPKRSRLLIYFKSLQFSFLRELV